jgi:hypothetical protein
MATGTNLAELLRRVRAEARHSPNAGSGINADSTIREMLARIQRVEWMDRPWRHLRVRREITTVAGQHLYAWPADLAFDRVVYAFVQWGTDWLPLNPGVTEADYNVLAEGERQDPPKRWDYREGNSLELWPTPATTMTIRLWGIKALGPLVADSDTAALDDDLLVLMAAAELLAQQKAPDAQAKLAAANRVRSSLLGNPNKSKVGSFLAGQRRGFHSSIGSRLEVVRGVGSVQWDGSGAWAE